VTHENQSPDSPGRLIKYTFVTAIEAAIDIAQHLCATQGWGPPSDNAGVVRLLGKHQAVTAATAESMRLAVGFRYVLVHEYVDVDDSIVLARLADLEPLEAFVHEIAEFLERA